jgi:hypothetical protein
MFRFSSQLSLTLAVSLNLFSGPGGFATAADFPQDPLGWPMLTRTQKPWTRWWWLGSAVDKPNLTRQLKAFAETGLGGVEICPVYGAVGAEDRSLDFLSPEWMEMLSHTTQEAKRLGLGVDMTTGTGWPFGGRHVTPDIASNDMKLIRQQANGGTRIQIPLPEGTLQCLRAIDANGSTINLVDSIKAGKLDWLPPAGKWEIFGISSSSPIQKVKRAAPGGEGNVLDPYSPSAMGRYLAAFDRAFEGFAAPMPRAQFHDSFEYYGAEWTPGFLSDFLTKRGYDLCDQLPAFAGVADADTVSRVRSDYRETLGELHLGYLQRWHDWTKAHGGITRNQAHGSPGNLLDHYAVSEIPETEIFRQVDENQIPMMRIAASAAHAKGHNLVSGETFTWLDEHFRVTPEKLKEAADFVFLGGVNHLFFHGIPYSPEDAKWPGWLFYASTHMGPNGGLWRDLSAFTGYLRRCQSILQEGHASSDVLIYYPIHDLWHNDQEKLPLFTIHNQNQWLWPTSFYHTSIALWKSGTTFDYASDRMLSGATAQNGKLILGGHAYSALILPGITRMPPETLERIFHLTSQGCRLIVQGAWPSEVPGLYQFEERRTRLLALEAKFRDQGNTVFAKESILPALAGLTFRETMTASGLRFIRRSHATGYHYFIVNRSGKPFNGLVPLAVPFQSAVILDPWNPATNGTALPVTVGKETGLSLQLAPGQSIIIRTFTERKVEGRAWVEPSTYSHTLAVQGPWNLGFIEGGPALPNPATAIQTGSWNTLPDAANFSGSARYTTTFDLSDPLPAGCQLDLGRVANTARVSLNGKLIGISWCEPHILEITRAIKTGKNELAVEVTNLAANRIADLDRRKLPWKQFHEINFVNIDYQPFDASAWPPLDSGLFGPVKLRFDQSH